VPKVRAATPADRNAIADYLAQHLQGAGGAARYRRFFEYGWIADADKPDLGMLVEDDGRVKGFIGAIYGRRVIRGREHKLCNLNCWRVDEDVRMHSLVMLKKLVDRREHDFVCVSPSDRVTEVLKFFKFQELDQGKILFAPGSGVPLDPRRWRVKVYDAKHGIEDHLDDEQRRVFRDHAPYRLVQWVIERGDRRCFAVMGRRGRGARVFADVLHVSDPALFVETIGLLVPRLLVTLGTPLVGLDRRYAAPAGVKPPRTIAYDKLRRPLYLSKTLGPTDLDALYTEFVPMFG
jgi:hypothetical protein